MKFLKSELAGKKTKIVLVPSTREINHIYPLPQPAYVAQKNDDFIRIGNPQTFMINDITFGILNSDAKIDIALKSILEQRTFYPVYPSNPASPIEWAQYRNMMFPDGITPDVLIIPSELMMLAKVRHQH